MRRFHSVGGPLMQHAAKLATTGQCSPARYFAQRAPLRCSLGGSKTDVREASQRQFPARPRSLRPRSVARRGVASSAVAPRCRRASAERTGPGRERSQQASVRPGGGQSGAAGAATREPKLPARDRARATGTPRVLLACGYRASVRVPYLWGTALRGTKLRVRWRRMRAMGRRAAPRRQTATQEIAADQGGLHSFAVEH